MPDAWARQPALRFLTCNTLSNKQGQVRIHLRSLVSAGHTTAMPISQFSNRGVLDRVYDGFIGRLGTLLTQGVHGKSQTRKHPVEEGQINMCSWLQNSPNSLDLTFPGVSLIAPAAQPPPPCFMSLGTFRIPFLLSRLRHQGRVFDSRGNLAWFKTPSQINSTALPPNLTSLPVLV